MIYISLLCTEFHLGFNQLPSVSQIADIITSVSLSEVYRPDQSYIFKVYIHKDTIYPIKSLLFAPSNLCFVSLGYSSIKSECSETIRTIITRFVFSFTLNRLSVRSPISQAICSPKHNTHCFSFSLKENFLSVR